MCTSSYSSGGEDTGVCWVERRGGGGVQLMGSITFLLSPIGRHGDRGSDLHRQGDQERPEHFQRQEQGDCVFVCVCGKKEQLLFLFFSFFLKSPYNTVFFYCIVHLFNESYLSLG